MGQSQLKDQKQKCQELIQNKKFQEALQVLDSMGNSDQEEIKQFVNFQRALCLKGLNQNDNAIQYFERCQNLESKINIIQIQIKQNQFDEAISRLNNLTNKNNKRNPSILQLQGDCLLFGQKNYQQAAQIFEISANLDNKQFDAYYKLACCYQNIGQIEKAKQYLEKSLYINPEYKPSQQMKKWFNLYLIENQKSNFEDYLDISKFLTYFKKAEYQDVKIGQIVTLNIYKKIYLYDIFQIYLKRNIKCFDQYPIKIKAHLLFMAGYVYSALNKYNLAYQYFKEKKELETDEFKIQAVNENIALCLLYQREYEESISFLQNQKEREKSQILLLCVYLCQEDYQTFFKELKNKSVNRVRNTFIFYLIQKHYFEKDFSFFQIQEEQIFVEIKKQGYLLGKLTKGENSHNLDFFDATLALLRDEININIQQDIQQDNFDYLYYTYHLIQLKQFLQLQQPYSFNKSVDLIKEIYKKKNNQVIVSQIKIKNEVYLKKQFMLKGEGKLYQIIPQQLINELLIGSFCLGSYLNYYLFYDYYQDENQQKYIAIYEKYYQEGNLQDFLKNNQLSKIQKQQLVLKLIIMLQQLHSKSVNHLDIKLTNIVIQKQHADGSIKPILIDYGTSIVNFNPINLIYKNYNDNIAYQNILFWSPSYEIPDQKVDNRSDIFNLGKVILEVYSNTCLKQLEGFKIDTTILKQGNQISNQLLQYIEEEIRNQVIFERPSIELILYQFQKDFIFDFLHSCLIDPSSIDYQIFMDSMYKHYEQFWIDMFQVQSDQQQQIGDQPDNFVFEYWQFISRDKINQMFLNNNLLVDLLLGSRLLYYFVHGILKFLQVSDADIDKLLNKIELQKENYLNEYQKSIIRIEDERQKFKEMIFQKNQNQQLNEHQQFYKNFKVRNIIYDLPQDEINAPSQDNFQRQGQNNKINDQISLQCQNMKHQNCQNLTTASQILSDKKCNDIIENKKDDSKILQYMTTQEYKIQNQNNQIQKAVSQIFNVQKEIYFEDASKIDQQKTTQEYKIQNQNCQFLSTFSYNLNNEQCYQDYDTSKINMQMTTQSYINSHQNCNSKKNISSNFNNQEFNDRNINKVNESYFEITAQLFKN